eukprot:gb/GECG01015237.1/.p1 GENE.gb/GECG01015237.1/~~gb/GECG01015237.1/.p1  ORF type:complete len:165 (+),score=10.93 gb/GECG01015237.1/:1-495(+)
MPRFVTCVTCPLYEWRGALKLSQPTITDVAFSYLSRLWYLDMEPCNQTTITSNAFRHLSSLQSLDMSGCYQTTISDDAFANLTALHTLKMRGCGQTTITDLAFQHLANLTSLDIFGCEAILAKAAVQHLPNLDFLQADDSLVPSAFRRVFGFGFGRIPEFDHAA